MYCNVRGRDVASFVEEAERAVRQKVKFPAGVYTVFGGVSEARKLAQQEILTYSVVAGVGIILFLAIAFHNIRNMLLVLVNLPFALIGGIVAGGPDGWNLIDWLASRICHAVWNYDTQLDHDDFAFRAPGAGRKRNMGIGGSIARSFRTADAGSHDCNCHRPWAVAIGSR